MKTRTLLFVLAILQGGCYENKATVRLLEYEMFQDSCKLLIEIKRKDLVTPYKIKHEIIVSHPSYGVNPLDNIRVYTLGSSVPIEVSEGFIVMNRDEVLIYLANKSTSSESGYQEYMGNGIFPTDLKLENASKVE